jgi:hypothetical protein
MCRLGISLRYRFIFISLSLSYFTNFLYWSSFSCLHVPPWWRHVAWRLLCRRSGARSFCPCFGVRFVFRLRVPPSRRHVAFRSRGFVFASYARHVGGAACFCFLFHLRGLFCDLCSFHFALALQLLAQLRALFCDLCSFHFERAGSAFSCRSILFRRSVLAVGSCFLICPAFQCEGSRGPLRGGVGGFCVQGLCAFQLLLRCWARSPVSFDFVSPISS